MVLQLIGWILTYKHFKNYSIFLRILFCTCNRCVTNKMKIVNFSSDFNKY